MNECEHMSVVFIKLKQKLHSTNVIGSIAFVLIKMNVDYTKYCDSKIIKFDDFFIIQTLQCLQAAPFAFRLHYEKFIRKIILQTYGTEHSNGILMCSSIRVLPCEPESCTCLMVRNLGLSSPAIISFCVMRRSGEDFVKGTRAIGRVAWGGSGASSIGEMSSEH